MKKGSLIIMLICSAMCMQAQSSQVVVYLQQISANKVLIEYIQKGYKIAKTGLTTIGDIRNGEFNLHRDFFGSLKAINPTIKQSAVVVDIIALQVKIIRFYKSNYKQIKASGQLRDAEINYIHSVFTKLLDDVAVGLEEFYRLVTADHYQLSDDERIQRLDTIYAAMQSNYAFARHFGNGSLVLALQRMKEKQEVDWSTKIFAK